MGIERIIILFVFIGIGAYLYPEDKITAAIVVALFWLGYYYEDDTMLMRDQIDDLKDRVRRLESEQRANGDID